MIDAGLLFGRGIAFPPRIDENGRMAFSVGEENVRDAITAVTCPVVEVHISNVHAREAFRHHSYLSAVCDAVIVGCGTQGYAFGIARIGQLTR